MPQPPAPHCNQECQDYKPGEPAAPLCPDRNSGRGVSQPGPLSLDTARTLPLDTCQDPRPGRAGPLHLNSQGPSTWANHTPPSGPTSPHSIIWGPERQVGWPSRPGSLPRGPGSVWSVTLEALGPFTQPPRPPLLDLPHSSGLVCSPNLLLRMGPPGPHRPVLLALAAGWAEAPPLSPELGCSSGSNLHPQLPPGRAWCLGFCSPASLSRSGQQALLGCPQPWGQRPRELVWGMGAVLPRGASEPPGFLAQPAS